MSSRSKLPIDDGEDTRWHSEEYCFLTKMQVLKTMLKSLDNDLKQLDKTKHLVVLDQLLKHIELEYRSVEHMENESLDLWKSQPGWAYYSHLYKIREQIAKKNDINLINT